MLPLKNIKVIELAGLAPVPFCGKILSDFGASVTIVENPKNKIFRDEFLNRGKKSIILDLKQQRHKDIFEHLVSKSDVLLDPFRPGVLERLGFHSDELRKSNPGLIVGKLSGFGQPQPKDSGELCKQRQRGGHDLNFLALSGLLSRLGSDVHSPPVAPINILADFAAGGLSGAFGVVMALLVRSSTGGGQDVDVNMSLGVSYLSSFVRDSLSVSHPWLWPDPQKRRGANLLDGGAPFYRCYRTRDDKWVSVAALEPQFYAQLIKLLGLDNSDLPAQSDLAQWPRLKAEFERVIATKSRSDWTTLASQSGQDDSCLAPVLDMEESAQFWGESGFCNGDVRPQPRLTGVSSDHLGVTVAKPHWGEHTEAVLTEAGVSRDDVEHVLQGLPLPAKL